MDIGSKNRLTPQSAALFAGHSLFDEIARTVCAAGVLPRKELYESWQFAKRVTRHVSGDRLVDLCAGHGLVAPILLLLDKRLQHALSLERAPPKSAAKIRKVMCTRWPALEKTWTLQSVDLNAIELRTTDLVTAVHACGGLTDQVLANAMKAHAAVAVMPCCHEVEGVAFLRNWLPGPLAIDTLRAARLAAAGYRVFTHHIDAEVTPQNRVLLAHEAAGAVEGRLLG